MCGINLLTHTLLDLYHTVFFIFTSASVPLALALRSLPAKAPLAVDTRRRLVEAAAQAAKGKLTPGEHRRLVCVALAATALHAALPPPPSAAALAAMAASAASAMSSPAHSASSVSCDSHSVVSGGGSESSLLSIGDTGTRADRLLRFRLRRVIQRCTPHDEAASRSKYARQVLCSAIS